MVRPIPSTPTTSVSSLRLAWPGASCRIYSVGAQSVCRAALGLPAVPWVSWLRPLPRLLPLSSRFTSRATRHLWTGAPPRSVPAQRRVTVRVLPCPALTPLRALQRPLTRAHATAALRLVHVRAPPSASAKPSHPSSPCRRKRLLWLALRWSSRMRPPRGLFGWASSPTSTTRRRTARASASTSCAACPTRRSTARRRPSSTCGRSMGRLRRHRQQSPRRQVKTPRLARP
mmetsp:Transcript_876/g.2309  ORF Transcript_876/g.2309 Transcript_876/m.2309 type:complete len:230 (+) Transcript_876:564-1253(+)